MKYYKRTGTDGKITTVESYSHDLPIEGAVEITEAEFNAYIASLPLPVPEPDSPNVVILKKYLADPTSGLPSMEKAFQALVRLYLGL